MTVFLQIVAPLVFNLPFTLLNAWEAETSARLAARVNALRAAGEPTTLAELAKTYPEPPPGKNAAPLYVAACKLLVDLKIEAGNADVPFVGPRALPKVDEEFPALMREQIRAYLARATEVLRLLHEAGVPDGCKFDIDFGKDQDMRLPHLAPMRGCARQLCLEAIWLTESGKPDQAAEALWAGLRLGHALGREPIVISNLVGMACDTMAVRQIERLMSRAIPSAPQLEKLQSALRAEADPKMVERLFIAERGSMLSIYQKYLGKPRRVGLDELGVPDLLVNKFDPPAFFKFIPPIFFKADMIEYIDLTNQYVAAAKKPYPQSFLECSRIRPTIDDQIPKYCLACRTVVPEFGFIAVQAQRQMAWLESARAALAALRCRAKRGRLPDRLQDLVPEFLDAVPPDPFNGESLLYRKEAAGFVIYSVGSNGKDDGGKIEFDGKMMDFPDLGFRVRFRWPKSQF